MYKQLYIVTSKFIQVSQIHIQSLITNRNINFVHICVLYESCIQYHIFFERFNENK